MSTDSEDADFLAFVEANAHNCTHAEMDAAKAATAHLLRRSRVLRAEYAHMWCRAIVDCEMIDMGRSKKDAAVAFVMDKLAVSKSLVWRALKLTRQRITD
jgi:hypothetical protein